MTSNSTHIAQNSSRLDILRIGLTQCARDDPRKEEHPSLIKMRMVIFMEVTSRFLVTSR